MRTIWGLFLCLICFNAFGQTVDYVTRSNGEKVVLYGDKTWGSRSNLKYDQFQTYVLSAPSFTGNTLDSGKTVSPISLKMVSQEPTNSVYADSWLERNNLKTGGTYYSSTHPDYYKSVPKDIAKNFRGGMISQHITDSNYQYIVYSGDRNRGRYLIIMNLARDSVIATLDFYRYINAPTSRSYGFPGFDAFTEQGLKWVECVNDTLYFSTSHSTYSDSSEGKNGYITCLDLKSKKVVWRSDPLVSNARTFVLKSGYIFSGYGFTEEDDFLYGLNRYTGKVILKHKLKKGPRFVIEKDNQLYVRTYNRNYVFDIIKKN
jgi:hypothetical protein